MRGTYYLVPSILELADCGCIGVQAGGLGTLAEHLGRLVTTETTAPLTTLLLILVRAAGKKNAVRIIRAASA